MKLSQPKTARTINTARVLNELRYNALQKDSLPVSKAELARILNLNKVSVGEIVDSLVHEGRVRETGKFEAGSGGRKANGLELVPDSGYVLAVDIGKRTTTIALCNMLSQSVKLERIPTFTADTKDRCTVEQFCVEIIKSCMRTIRLVDSAKLFGCGITVCGLISEDGSTILSSPYLPWKNIQLAQAIQQTLKLDCVIENSTTALVLAEQIASSGSDILVCPSPILYLEWGDRLDLRVVSGGKVCSSSMDFGHLKVSQKGLCSCGEIGCLEAQASAWAVSGNSETHLMDSWDRVGQDCLVSVARGLRLARKVTGAERAVISGEGSTIPDDVFSSLEKISKSIMPEVEIRRSVLGDKANITSAAEIALDRHVYFTSILKQMSTLL